ncbi:unnamed protein product [Effrenium voratum]|nr:unnamed protein product [Effrenium voratum]
MESIEPMEDPKLELHRLGQRLLRRPLVKTDIVFTHQTWEVGIQATATLAFAENREACGELCKTVQEAEESALHQALLIYEDELKELIKKHPQPFLPTPKARGTKREGAHLVPPKKNAQVPLEPVGEDEQLAEAWQVDPNTQPDTEFAELDGFGDPALLAATPKARAQPNGEIVVPAGQLGEVSKQAKQELIGFVAKIVRKPMNKGDVAYDCKKVIGGYQATVKFFCLDGEWENAVFVGEVRPDKAIAEHSAAAVAFAELQKDVVLRARAAAPNPNKSKKASQWTWKPPNPAAVPRAVMPQVVPPRGRDLALDDSG